jgi:RimJ/RimL family protein N-acetyltransferase
VRILDACELTIREATESDAERLLEWRNDPETLTWSRGHQPVAEPAHRAWLSRTLTDPERLLLIVESDHPVGTVRFDRHGAEPRWEVSITVAPRDRGRGLAARILTVGEGALRARHGAATIVANVHRDNAASLALFQHAGYADAARPPTGPYVWLEKRSCPQPFE